MAKDPAFLFYPIEFLAECFGLTESEIGTFLIALIEQFKYGHLSSFDLMKVVNGNEKIIKKFTEDNEGSFYNKWLQIKIDERKAYSESRRKNRMGEHILSHDNISLDNLTKNDIEDEDENININKDINKDKDGKKQKNFIPPTVDEVKQYIKEINYTDIDPSKWWNFYESKGWMIGKNKMKNWRSAVATWHNDKELGQPVQKNTWVEKKEREKREREKIENEKNNIEGTIG